MSSKVFFVPLDRKERDDIKAAKLIRLFDSAGLNRCVGKKELTAVKMHFGEKGNDTYVSPDLVRPIIKRLKELGTKPFLTDTCVLYKSQRDNAVDHLHLAQEHGFTIPKVGAPVVIADGITGGADKEVAIPGKIDKKVSIAGVALEANAIIVLTHVTGHLGTGIGGAIKNVGMGFASRKGKLRQHSVMKPQIKSKVCTGCSICVQWCPADAITMTNDIAHIDEKTCIGCAECLTVCRYNAVAYDWKVDESELQRRMAEHALGVVHGREKKIGYINFLVSITKDCDCWGERQPPLFPDIGVMASTDPVALDAASLNMILEKTGKELQAMSYPNIDPWIQVKYGEEIGLGTQSHELVVLS